ncbi:MAG: hypothetical protein K9G76_11940 [Bacteroidales bacterium]|nr:hypothetical protein [Bacteroidales bacterium]MCF8405154.1 hypothetical protein [Bacteroidales bacterium]
MKSRSLIANILLLFILVMVFLSCTKEEEVRSPTKIGFKSNLEAYNIFPEVILPWYFENGVFDKDFTNSNGSNNFTQNQGNANFTYWYPGINEGNAVPFPGIISAKVGLINWYSNQAYAYHYAFDDDEYLYISGMGNDGSYISIGLDYNYISTNASLSINHGVFMASYWFSVYGESYHAYDYVFVNITYFLDNKISGNFHFTTTPEGSQLPIEVKNGEFINVPVIHAE